MNNTSKKPLNSALRIFSWFLIAILIFIALILNTLSYTIPFAAQSFFERKQINFSLKSLTIKPIRGIISFSGLSIANSTSEAALTIDQFNLTMDIWGLIRQQKIALDELTINNITIPVAAHKNKFYIAGIEPARLADQTSSEKITPTTSNTPWQLEWQSINIKNVSIMHTDIDANSLISLQLKQLGLGRFSTLEQDIATPVNLSLSVKNIDFDINGTVTAGNTPSGSLNTTIKQLDISRLQSIASHFSTALPSQLANASAIFDYTGQLKFQLAAQPSIELTNATLVGNDLQFLLNNNNEREKSPAQHLAQGKIGLHVKTINIEPLSKQFSANNISTFDSRISYINGEHSPATQINIDALVFTLDKIDSHYPDQLSSLNLSLKIGEFGKLTANGKSALLNYDKNSQFQIIGEQINLTDFGRLAADYLNRSIDKGALDLNVNAKIKDSNIDSSIELDLHQLSFAPNDISNSQSNSQKVNQNSFDSQLGIPLNTALNLLRDKHDSIHLAIPINGPIYDPQIHLNHIVNKAILNTLKTAALTQLGPLMVIGAFDTIKNLSDATQLKPIIFDSGLNTLNQEAIATLDKLAAFLSKREQIYINVCAYALNSELMQPEQTMTHDQALLDLAKQRANTTKDYLINKKVEGKRLVLCAAVIDQNTEGQPRVTFSL